MSKLMLIEIWH